MALMFSAVTVTAENDETKLLVGGIPQEYDDLEGWADFDDFMDLIHEETDVNVHAEVYLYGEGETVKASPEEIVYLIKRIANDENFFINHCDYIEDKDFTIRWSPEELYGLEMD